MLKLYGADDAIEAHLLKHMLEQRRIPVFITGEYLSGAAGEVPVAGLVDVWVLDELYEEALDVLDDFFESQDGPLEDDDDDELIGPDGYYNDDMEDDDSSEDSTSKKAGQKNHDDTDDTGSPGNTSKNDNPWNRVYRKF